MIVSTKLLSLISSSSVINLLALLYVLLPFVKTAFDSSRPVLPTDFIIRPTPKVTALTISISGPSKSNGERSDPISIGVEVEDKSFPILYILE